MSGSFNPINLVSTVALTAVTGGGSLYAQLAMQVVSSMGSEVLSRLSDLTGQGQGGFQDAISGLGSFSGAGQQTDPFQAIENLGQATGASPSDIGQAQRDADETINDVVRQCLDQSREAQESSGTGSSRGKGWLRAMAEALGQKLDQAAHEMQDLADKINKKDPSTSVDFQVSSQEFNNLMNATTTAIKSIGEGMSNAARKQ